MNLRRLKLEGLVERFDRKDTSGWRLTEKGKEHLSKERKNISLPSQSKKDGTYRLVIFDIPEDQRKKRDLIRFELINCRFRQLQKSVWIGEYPLPQDFITLIDDLRLTRHIHIFSVQKTGTLNREEG